MTNGYIPGTWSASNYTPELWAKICASVPAEDIRENPWLGDADRRGDDDVEFCDEGDDPDDE